MTEQISNKQLDKETDAMIIQIEKDENKGYLKFGASLILVSIFMFVMYYVVMAIPSIVMGTVGH